MYIDTYVAETTSWYKLHTTPYYFLAQPISAHQNGALIWRQWHSPRAYLTSKL